MPTSEEIANAKRRRKEELKAQFFNAPLACNRYKVIGIIGEGAYGVVCSAVDTTTGSKVAVKRILKTFDNYPMATRILRELKFLRLLSPHENIIQVKDVLLPGDLKRFNDTFVVQKLMPADLSRAMRSTVVLRPEHIKYFMFQLLRGINFMHTANVLHRDLKPNNILINSRCELRICDFGLARATFENGPDTMFWTDYVATRWYRAPELLMNYLNKYSTAIDMWSVGCIFAEMLGNGTILFPGKNSRHQFEMIIDVLGPVPMETIEKMNNPQAKRVLAPFMNGFHQARRPLHMLFRHADPLAVRLLSRMLTFDPDTRISAIDALNSQYFSEYLHLGYGAQASPLPAKEFAFESRTLTPEQMREEFIREILQYHPDATEEVLRSWSSGREYIVPSPAERFSQQLDELQSDRNGRLQSQTLQERVLEHITEDRPATTSGGFASHRQHVTMTESELERINRR